MELQNSLGYLLNTSARYLKRNLETALKHYDITTAQWAILKLLAAENNLSQAELAERANTDRATCGAVIDKLIAKKMVEKQLSPDDRRSYIVKILPAALVIADEVSVLAEQVNQAAIEGLSDAEVETLCKCLNTIIENGRETNRKRRCDG